MNASTPAAAPALPAAASSIDPAEAARFGAMAKDWWDPKGSSAMLHRLNPVRLKWLREMVDRHWALDDIDLKPLAGRRVLDVGCGAGLLAEPLARLGGRVTGLDAAPENVAVAGAHAAAQGLAIDYRAGSLEDLGGDERFDLVTCMEVIEHVANPAAFVGALAGALAPGGLLLLSTPNRTPLSRLAVVALGESVGGIPRGTHDWQRFLTPDELSAHVAAAGLGVLDVRGLAFSPTRGFRLSDDRRVDYLMAATA